MNNHIRFDVFLILPFSKLYFDAIDAKITVVLLGAKAKRPTE